MIVKVRMIAFMEGEIREVSIPDETDAEDVDAVLAATFHYGQNAFQPVEDRCSVSVGDVIEYKDKLHIVAPVGFKEITEAKYAEIKSLPRRDRTFAAYDFVEGDA